MKYKTQYYESKRGEDGLFHFIYKITNNINGKYYIGVHNTTDLGDGYKGSGSLIKKAFKKYGKKNFSREILEFYDSDIDAYKAEEIIITDQLINDPNCYNLMSGGLGSKTGVIPSINIETGEYVQISKSNPNYDENIYKSVNLGYRRAIDKNTGKSIRIKVEDFDDNIHDTIYKNMITVYNTKTNNYERVNVKEYHENKHLISPSKNKVTVKDKYGVYYQVNKDDPRYLSGELSVISKNSWILRDKVTNKCISVPKNSEIDWNRFEFATCRRKKEDDPNYILARTIDNNKYKYVLKSDKRFETFDLIPYIKKGNTIRNCSITNGIKELSLKEDEADIFLKFHSDWYKGRLPHNQCSTKGKVWINNGEINKMIEKNILNKFLSENSEWKKGILIKDNLNDKKVRVTDGFINKFIYSKKLKDFFRNNPNWYLYSKSNKND